MSKGEETKQRILDAAEQLFADSGFVGVSMRNVAEAAEVGLGVLTYHYATKEELFESVIARRAGKLNKFRRQALKRLGPDATLEDVLLAFFQPYLALVLRGGAGWLAYGRLIAQTGQSPRSSGLISRHFDSAGHQMIERMMSAEPGLDRHMAARGYVHMVSLMVGVFAGSGLLDRFSDSELSGTDFVAAFGPMIAFAAGGIRQLALDGERATAMALSAADSDFVA